MSQQRYQHRSPQQWQTLIEQQATSGLNQAAFCTREGIAKSSFQLWKRRLRSAGVAAPVSSRDSDTKAALFAPVMATEAQVADHDAHG
ncbi:MAG: hypothetical protein LC652_06120 [Halomonas sp.]|nr:hypothetical protein [Halomonas sp.]